MADPSHMGVDTRMNMKKDTAHLVSILMRRNRIIRFPRTVVDGTVCRSARFLLIQSERH